MLLAAGRMYAFVNFRNPEDAKRAVSSLNDREVSCSNTYEPIGCVATAAAAHLMADYHNLKLRSKETGMTLAALLVCCMEQALCYS